MDVTRILSKTADELKETDIADSALETLVESQIKQIYLIGRRGPIQEKFTPIEIGELADCEPVFNHQCDLELDEISRMELADDTNRQARHNLDVLLRFVQRQLRGYSEQRSAKTKRYHLRFLTSPQELKGNGKVERIVLERNRLVGEPFRNWPEGTGQFEELPCGAVFRSIGYRGVPIPGVPFGERNGVFPNKDGRILNGETIVPGLYAVGWIKRGPSG